MRSWLMLETLELKNFKSFLDQRFEFKPLTILAGINASGKSSVVEAIKFLYDDKSKEPMHFDDEPYALDDMKSKLTRDDWFCVSALWNGENLRLRIDLLDENPPQVGLNQVLERNDLQLISASRIGPQEYYKLNPLSKDAYLDKNGQFIFDYILKKDEKNTKIDEKLKYEDSVSFKDNVSDWLQIISPNSNLKLDITKDRKQVKPYYNDIEAVETGFGISYSLPIIATLLDSNIKLLVIDSPEAHLHPKGQSELCKLIARAVATGKQVVLETHSDHIIDGVRVAVKQELINCDDVTIYFLERDANEPSKATKISVDSYGNLSEWPEDFFDQTIKDAGVLL